MNKLTILLVSCIVLTLSASGMLAWHLFGKNILSPQQGTADILSKFSDATPTPTTPTTTRKLIPLGSREAVSLAIGSGGRDVVYYEKTTGKVFSNAFTGGSERTISNTPLHNFIKSTWSSGAKEVLSFFSSTSTPIVHYDYASQKGTSLPSSIHQAGFSPDGKQMAFVRTEDSSSWISIGTLASNKKIFNTRSATTDIQWTSPDTLAITLESTQGTSAVFTLALSGELTRITDFVQDLRTRWTPGGESVLTSFTDGKGIARLVAYDIQKKNQTLIPVKALAHHCAWMLDMRNIICEVSGERGQSLQKIEVFSGKKEVLLGDASGGIAIEEIILSPLEDYIIFIDASDHRPYSIKL